MYSVRGQVFYSVDAAAEAFGASVSGLRRRMRQGHSIEEAIAGYFKYKNEREGRVSYYDLIRAQLVEGEYISAHEIRAGDERLQEEPISQIQSRLSKMRNRGEVESIGRRPIRYAPAGTIKPGVETDLICNARWI